MKIAVLADSLINRIAAGEVVERPASVVKELVDNSLDAGASEISVWTEGNGTSLIKVADDGEGIAFDELSLAFERHSTSKIRIEEDLVRIASLGFRGEALPSIASVASVEVLSRTSAQEFGGRLEVVDGARGLPQAAGCPIGTTVEVRDLFLRVPARRKFLKSPRTELGHIAGVVDRLALGHEAVHFRLYHAGRMLADYVATQQARERIGQVFGDMGRELVPFDFGRGRVHCYGFASVAPKSFGSSRYLFTFVNRRFVRDRLVTHALLRAYDTLLMKGRFPAVVLYLDVPFDQVDVNVHPAKTEVRFRVQSDVYETVVAGVRSGLESAARGASAAAGRGAERAQVAEGRAGYQGSSSAAVAHVYTLDFGPQPLAPAGTVAETERRTRFAALEVVGQVLGCYIVCQGEPGLILLDQHAAHERLAYERMRKDLEQGIVETQELLIPQVLELSAHEGTVLEAHLGVLRRAGFRLEGFGPNTFSIRGVPALLAAGDYRDAVRSMIAELAEAGGAAELEHGLRERLMTIACHSVIRAHRALRKEEMERLLKDLDTIAFATQCPHGRPVMVEFRRSQLERMFRRT